MSLLDKLTKAVSDTVDRGKKEVDEFMRIQKVKGEISEAERRMQEAANRIADIKRSIGDRAVEMMKSGALVHPELQAMAGPIADFERHIDEQRAVVADKKLQIERIKAEGDAPTPPAAPEVVPAPPVTPPPPPSASADIRVTPPPPPTWGDTSVPPTGDVAATPPATPGPRFCLSCGKPVAPGAEVCGNCGAQLG